MYMGFDKLKYQNFVDRFDLDISYASVYEEEYLISTRDKDKKF